MLSDGSRQPVNLQVFDLFVKVATDCFGCRCSVVILIIIISKFVKRHVCLQTAAEVSVRRSGDCS